MTVVNTSNVHELTGEPDGLKIGQSASDLIGFHGATPSAQAALVTNTSGTLGNTNTALSAVITCLISKGLMAAS